MRDQGPVSALPEGSLLLHIGPYKTGSSAIQMALHHRREELSRLGVLYPGTAHRQMRPGWGVLGRTPRGMRPAGIDEWERLVEEVRRSDAPRVCISTEDLATAGPVQSARVVADLGRDRVVHVIATTRRLDRLLPSQWQERIKTCRETKTYDQWLRVVLDTEPVEPSAKAFWASHDVTRMVGKWVDAVGPERFHLIVTDDSDRQLLPRVFGQLLGLPDDFFGDQISGNSSLSWEKIELLRRVTEMFDAHGLSDKEHLRIGRQGVLRALKAAPASAYDQPIPPLPHWAAVRVAELSAERVAAIKGLGVQVVGDPECLYTKVPNEDETTPDTPDAISLDSALLAVEGAVEGAIALSSARARRRRAQAEAAGRARRTVDDTSTRELLRLVLRRVGGATRRRVAPGRGHA